MLVTLGNALLREVKSAEEREALIERIEVLLSPEDKSAVRQLAGLPFCE